MLETQNETMQQSGELKAESRRLTVQRSAFRFPPSAFTLVELLVVITIIGILAALITGAAINAMNKAKQAAITMELQQIGAAMEDLKNEMGAYPPNALGNGQGYTTTSMFNKIESDFERMFKKAFPRSQEPSGLIKALAGNVGGNALVGKPSVLTNGMTPSEAMVFWLGGFSKDTQYPISGTGGPSFADGDDSNNTLDPSDEVLENRNFRYEFDMGRLSPKDSSSGIFNGRTITYDSPLPGGGRRQINLWTYVPSGSLFPVIYFDTSRHDPEDYDPNLADAGADPIYAIKQLREGFNTTNTPKVSDITFANQGKYQILHCGTDDIWGNFTPFWIRQAANANDASAVGVSPEGPFIGDIADTVGNFLTGTLEDEQE